MLNFEHVENKSTGEIDVYALSEGTKLVNGEEVPHTFRLWADSYKKPVPLMPKLTKEEIRQRPMYKALTAALRQCA